MHEALLKIQAELKVPKNQTNKFGKYNYRSCEDILEAVKPLCQAHGVTLTLSDRMVEVGGRVYVCATAEIVGKEFRTEALGWAREPLAQAGMAEPQITGSASSYARKYALNGLFAIDDTKDADATNTHGHEAPGLSTTDALARLSTSATLDELRAKFLGLSPSLQKDPEVVAFGQEIAAKLKAKVS